MRVSSEKKSRLSVRRRRDLQVRFIVTRRPENATRINAFFRQNKLLYTVHETLHAVYAKPVTDLNVTTSQTLSLSLSLYDTVSDSLCCYNQFLQYDTENIVYCSD